jgi:carboxylesterase type B
MWLVLEIMAALALSYVRAERPLVTTTLGELEGVWQTSAKGLQYAAFMGIPYAQPPVGDLRFEVSS